MRSLQHSVISWVVPVLAATWLLVACDTDVTIPPPAADAGADGASKDAAADVQAPDGSDGAVGDAAPTTDAEAGGDAAADSTTDSEVADAGAGTGDAGEADASLDASGE